jgi:hypothetical protein
LRREFHAAGWKGSIAAMAKKVDPEKVTVAIDVDRNSTLPSG